MEKPTKQLGNVAGIYQLEFSHRWYKAIQFNGRYYTPLKIKNYLEANEEGRREEQERIKKDKETFEKKFNQLSFLDEGNDHGI